LQSELAEQRSRHSETERELDNLREELARLEQKSTEDSRQSGTTAISEEPKIIAFALSPQLRGAGQIATLTIPADTDSIALQLELEPNSFAFYRAGLRSQSKNQIIWRSGRLRATGSDIKRVRVNIRASLLQPQIYVMEVSGISSTGEAEIISSYPFRVVK